MRGAFYQDRWKQRSTRGGHVDSSRISAARYALSAYSTTSLARMPEWKDLGDGTVVDGSLYINGETVPGDLALSGERLVLRELRDERVADERRFMILHD